MGPDGPTGLDRTDLVLDGIVGLGARGGLRPPAAALVAQAAAGPGLMVAVDLPSGVDPDTGAVEGTAFPAQHTVTFGAVKAGLVVGEGRAHAGQVHLVDIGLADTLPRPRTVRLTDAEVAARLDPPTDDDDKYSRGVVGVVAGSATYPGAAVLCTGAALRSRPGLVRYAGTAAAGVRAAWPEAIVTEGRPADAGRVQAWVVGPGMGTDDDAADVVAEVLATDLPVLLDADALTLAARRPELVRDRAAPTVLTPHDREYERFGEPVGPDRLGAARRLAADLGAVVLLKGAATVVAAPDGQAYVERHRHAVAGHRRHRRRPLRDRRQPARLGPAGGGGGGRGRARARPGGAAGRRGRAADRRRPGAPAARDTRPPAPGRGRRPGRLSG